MTFIAHPAQVRVKEQLRPPAIGFFFPFLPPPFAVDVGRRSHARAATDRGPRTEREECLRRAGFELWDLGGADHSPMMQYKPQVALDGGWVTTRGGVVRPAWGRFFLGQASES